MISNTVRAAQNFFYLLFSQVFTRILGFIVLIIIARKLGADGLGIFSFSLAIISYFLIFGDLGLSVLGQREIAAHPEEKERIIQRVFTLKVFFSSISFLGLISFLLISNQSGVIKWVTFIFGLTVLVRAFTPEWYFTGVEKMSYIAISTFLNRFIYAFIAIIILFVFPNIIALSCAWLAGACIGAGYLYYKFRIDFIKKLFRWDVNAFKLFLSKSIPMSMAFFMTQIYFNFDTIMLGIWKTQNEVGWYNSGYKIIFLIINFSVLFGTVILPVFSRFFVTNRPKLEIAVRNSFRISSTFGLVIAIIFVVYGHKIFDLIYGTGFENGVLAFQILSITAFTAFASIPFSYFLLASDQQKKYLFNVSIGAIVNICLNFLLIPKYGITGAAISTIITEFVVMGMMMFYASKEIRLKITTILLRLVLCGACASYLFLTTQDNWILGLVLGCSSYILLLIILKIVTFTDLRILYSIFLNKIKPNIQMNNPSM